ncbi:MAG: HEAT repeat domain-containing protein [Actinobacteria bacterium]|nr:HEAT repeat domain-containing protein [Actinomycetota bacterium]
MSPSPNPSSGPPPNPDSPDPIERAAAAAEAGVTGAVDRNVAEQLAEAVQGDPDARVREAALGALARADTEGRVLETAWAAATTDGDGAVRRRAAELAPEIPAPTAAGLIALLGDSDPLVAEAAAFALGELGDDALDAGAVAALSRGATAHHDPLVRESAVAALGALGDDGGLPAVLAALGDRPPVRRRAVLALAAFEGPEVEAALQRALADRDWQVRQAAEDLRRR